MRIISNFKDFYDGVMRTGMDRDIVYVREKKVIETTEDFGVNFDTSYSAGSYIYGNRLGYSVRLLFLGYCGQIIRVMDLTYDVKNPDPSAASPLIHYRKIFYDYDKFEDFMLANNLAGDWDFRRTRWSGKFEHYRTVDTKKMEEIFHRYQVPLFLLTHVRGYRVPSITKIDLGPTLQDIGLQRYKDAYTVYQDIFQYVAGVLNRPENKMVQISDKDKIHKHGFNKFSFRKMPSKKK